MSISEVLPLAPITARKITSRLWMELRGSSELIVPRYTPANWWECDLWRLTKSGFVDEYEIKLSVADFRKDFEKELPVFNLDYPLHFKIRTREVERKHSLLADGNTRCPNRFWFVVAEEIADRVEIPSYAGLITARMCRNSASVVTVKKAPMIHKTKWTGDLVAIRNVFYWRFWNLEARA